MESFQFNSDREISENTLLNVLRTVIPVTRLVRLSDSQSESKGDEDDVFVLYLEKRTGNGQFGHQYQLYSPAPSESLTRREEVEILREIARQSNADILTDEECDDPFVFVHIDAQGETSIIAVESEAYNDRDELNIEGIYEVHWGTFATETPLQESEKMILESLLSTRLIGYHLEHIEDGPVRIEFGQYKNNFSALRNFIHHHFVRTAGKHPWYSKDEKSVWFTGVMTLFYEQTKRKVCIFPVNHREVQNIPGGSDSEAHCILIDEKGSARIVFKPRRKSW